jgi:hypothetical protein
VEDKLIVKGVHDEIDGEHPCDIIGMLTIGHPESMTNRELHRIKSMTGILAGDLMDAINNSDMDASVALAAVILERRGKTFQDEWLWDAPMGAGITFEIRKVKEEELPPPSDAPKSTPTGGVETSGGVPSEPSSESPENDQSGTGSPSTDTSAT